MLFTKKTLAKTSQPSMGCFSEVLARGFEFLSESFAMASVSEYRLAASDRILIIDDDPTAREALAVAVVSAGFDPVPFEDAETALAQTEGQAFCLAFVDVNLPHMSGLDLAPILQKDERVLDVIFMSSRGTFDHLLTAIKLGAYDYLRKPFRPSELNLLFKRYTERVGFRRSVAEAEQRHQDLIQSLPLLVYTLDQNLELKFINRSCRTMLGVEPEAAMGTGQWLLSRVHLDDQDMVRSALRAAMDSDQPCFLECRLMHGNGHVVHGILQSLPGAAPDHDNSGNTRRSLEGIFVDITDRVILERALVQNEKLKTLGAVSAEVAHEVRNPLMSIAGFARRLSNSDPDRPEVGIILRESKRLEQLLARIGNYLRPMRAQQRPVDLNTVVLDCVAMLQPELNDGQVWAGLDLDRSLPEIRTDADGVAQVFINLVRNGIAALEPGQALHVKTFASGANVIVEFRNPLRPGQVINPEHLFLPFDEGGQHFGLPVSYRMIKNMGGLLAFMNEPGQAVFTVSLPRGHGHASLEPPEDEAALEENGHCFEDASPALTRRRFDHLLERALKSAVTQSKPLSLILVDVDHFTEFARFTTHQDMGSALNRIGHALDQALGDPCRLLGRHSIQEYVALLPGTDAHGAERIAERMRATVANLAIPYNGDPSRILTVSLGGVSVAPAAEIQGRDLVEEANRSLYLAKQKGRNAVHVSVGISLGAPGPGL
ncbi:MAG: response regulator [Desulfovibrio sp.]|nr:MAG: response regulator [Desulfovibrio sp.]